ncbi:YdbL family protein [Sphingobium sp. YR768]|uniref:YdbL family protein n=1 Tax=Sphingobium sp. YR768 TaxID=1884365 RepID=UPI0008B5CCD6|nr:YdbL family protein [Sphingobium sp. YR768]SER59357.1 hypothetical protein SAMN05518866_11426 [Sphingobium sp. YR768]
MTRKIWFVAAALGLAVAGPVMAQSGAVAAAMSAGTVGEQADGYLGIAGTVGADVRSEVESINIKRRAAYTQLAGQRGVTVQDMAAATACQTLTRLKQGQAYRIGAGAWQTKGAGAISLPSYCATAG